MIYRVRSSLLPGLALSACVFFVLTGCDGQFRAVGQAPSRLVILKTLDQAGDLTGARRLLAELEKEGKFPDRVREYRKKMEERKPKAEQCVLDMRARIKGRLFPRSIPRYYYHMGVCQETLGRSREALRSYNQSIHLRPRVSAVFTRRALARSGLGDLSGAEQDLLLALALNKRYFPAMFHLGLLYVRQGRISLAKRQARNLSKSRPLYAQIIRARLAGRGPEQSNIRK